MTIRAPALSPNPTLKGVVPVNRNSIGWIVFVIVAIVALVSAPYAARRAGLVHEVVKPDLLTGKPAPEFGLASLEGKTIHLSDYRGKAVLLNFWATWCAPCKVEIPWFEELQKQYGPQGLQIVGVATRDESSPQEIAEFAKKIGVNYPILVGNEAVASAYGGVPFLPSTFFINREGKVVGKIFGVRGRSEIEAEIKLCLGEAHLAQR